MPTPRHRRLAVIGAVVAGASLLGLWGCTASLNPLRLGDHTNTVTQAAKTGAVAVGVSMPSIKRQISAVEDDIDHITVTVNAKDNAWSPALTVTFGKSSLGTGTAWKTFSSVPVGKVFVTAVAYAADNSPIPGGSVTSDELTINAGQVTNAVLELKWEVGGLSTLIKVTVGSPVGLTPGTAGPLQATALMVGGASRFEDTLANADGTNATHVLSAAAYSCGTCHTDVQDVFKHAAHNTWESKLSSSCYPCHTPGADPNQSAGSLLVGGKPVGFDFTKPANDPTNVGFLGIQCESCHGAGGNHITSTNLADKLASITRVPSYKQSCLRCHLDSWNKVERMAMANTAPAYVKPSFPTYMVSNEDVNSSGGGAFLRHGKQGEVMLGGGGYLFEDSNTPASKSTTATAATYPLNPMTSLSNPHRDSVDNGCISCHMNPTDPERHQPAIGEKRDHVVVASCQNCHGTGFTANSIETYKASTQRDLDTLASLLVQFRQTHARQVLNTSNPAYLKTTRIETASSSWATDVASLSLPVSLWDDSPAFVTSMYSDPASMSATTNWLGDSKWRGWSSRMTTYNAAWWNYVLLNGMTYYSNSNGVITPGSTIGEEAGGIHNPAYSKMLIRQSIKALRAAM